MPVLMTTRPLDCLTPCPHHGPRGCTLVGGDDFDRGNR